MRDEDKTKEQLAEELAELRQRIAGLEASETERTRAESQREATLEALRQSRERERFLADVIRKADQPVGISYPGGRLGICNRAFCELTGYSEEELQSLDWSTVLTPPEWLEPEMEALAELERTGKPVRYQKEYIRKDGRRVPIELLAHIVRDESGKVYYYAFVTDITERKRAEEELHSAHRKLRASFDAIQDPLNVVDLDFNLTDVNGPLLAAFGLPDSESVLGRKCFEALMGRRDPCSDCAVAEAYRTKAPVHQTTTLEGKPSTGGRSFERFAYPIVDEQGNLSGAVEFARDITERVRAESQRDATLEALKGHTERLEEIVEERTQELREREQWLSTTLRSIGDAVIATDAQGVVTLMNPVAEDLTGWDEAEAVGKPLEGIFCIVNEQTGEGVASPVARVLRKGGVVGLANHTLLIARDGTKRPIADSGAPMRDEAGKVIGTVMVFRDITAGRRAEEELRQHRDHLEELVEQRTAELAGTNKELETEIAERVRAESQRDATLEALARRVEELERFNRLAVGRELRMIELKRQINRLSEQLGREAPYDLSILEG